MSIQDLKDKIELLTHILDQNGITECPRCNNYQKDRDACDYCDNVSCDTCSMRVSRHKRRGFLSGIYACDECSNKNTD